MLVAERGLRVDQTIAGSGNTFLSNSATGQIWFLDRNRALLHEVPLRFGSGESDDSVTSVSTDDIDAYGPGFLSYQPCSGLEGQLNSTVNMHGRSLQLWSCSDDLQLVEQQWFDTRFGVVVRAQSLDGYVGELVDLRERQVGEDSFLPPSHFRVVSIEELINDYLPIGSYQEPANP